MSLSNTYETAALKWLFHPEGTTASSTIRPANLKLALFTATPSDTAFGTEVSGGAYARQDAAFTVTGNQASNTSAIEFAEATANYGDVAAVAIVDHATNAAAANIIAYAALSGGAKTINTGDIFRIPVGDLDINLD